MKKLTLCILLFCLILPCFGCSNQESVKTPVLYYYCRSELSYDGAGSVITPEQRESAGHEEDIPYLLGQYLSGPKSSTLLQTFPTGTKLVSFTLEEKEAEVILNDGFAELSGMELTIACACITMTVTGLTEAETVHIRTESELLNNMEKITMSKDDLLLFDSSAATD